MQALETDIATNDLGPLAWVLDELRKSLDSASAALRRFVRDTGLARGTDMASVDGGQLRIARQQLHQAVGALEMVGLGAPAHMLRSMEAAVQTFIERPELCNEAAAAKVERAGFALAEYLEGVLLGKPVSAIALFPQYRDTQELAGADRVHPADLWGIEWRWNEPQTPAVAQALVYDPAVRKRLDQDALRLMKTGDAEAARELAGISLSLAATQTARQPKIFWKVCAGFFEAIAAGALAQDVYVKRAVSRVLLQYSSLAKGEQGVSDRLAHDLVFFCSQAVPASNVAAPALASVRLAWGLARFAPVDYHTAQYGRFDPVLLAHARKRIGFVKEIWSALSGGDAAKLKGLAEQFHSVTDALVKLHAPSAPLGQALNSVIEAVVRSARVPAPELAMEVATAVLYLEAAFADLDPSDSQLAVRTARLAERLDTARQGGNPEALEPWMEELYRRVSDRQTMGSVVGELRGTLGELEKLLDQFFRNIEDKSPLRDAPTHLSQMRGVLSVLGLDQAAQAVLRMRESVEEIMVTQVDAERARSAGTFDKLGNNLGALGFLIDMLNYQPSLAKKLFVYDDSTGELRPLMGRTGHSVEFGAATEMPAQAEPVVEAAPPDSRADLPAHLDTVAVRAAPADGPAIAQPARDAAAEATAQDAHQATARLDAPAIEAKPVPAPAPAAADESDIDEDDLLDIFLEEAREVVQNGLAAIGALAANPGDISELTTLRRAFHTLKGSSRMVGLNEFGEAAWSLEQVLNTWLADQKPAGEELRTLASAAMHGFARWVEDIAAHDDGAWKAGLFRGPADTFRTQNRLVPLVLPEITARVPVAPAQPQLEEAAADAEVAEIPPSAEPAPADSTAAIEAISFDLGDDLGADLPLEPEPPVQVQLPVSDYVAAFGSTQVLRMEPGEELEPPPPEDLGEFDFDISPSGEVQPEPADAQPERAEAQQPVEIDFTSLSAFSNLASDPAPAASQEAESEPASLEPEVVELGATDAQAADEQVKVIGSLRIGIPLYNVYLNEADEWSRRLVQELAEWALELNQPIPDSAVGLAHALAGSSATVGFHTLSDIARALESSLQHAQGLAHGTQRHAKAFVEAAEEIRRLLHQFAAGFLKESNTQVVADLWALNDLQDSVLPADDQPEPAAGVQVQAQAVQAPAADAPPAAAPTLAAAATFTPQPAAARPVVDFAAEQDEIDAQDAIDPDLFSFFEDEAAELMPQLGGALRQWNARPDNRSARDEVLRALHTLKGSARLAGALRLGELAHRLESHVERIAGDSVAAADVEPLLHFFDGMQGTFDALRARGGAQTAPETSATDADIVHAPETLVAPVEPAAPARALVARPVVTNLAPQRVSANQAVRVRSQLLDRLVNQAGEVMITRSRLEAELRQLRGSLSDLTGNLDRLRSQLRDIELQAESQMQSRLAQAKDSAAGFDPLEFDRFTRVQELTRMMAESVNDVATVQRNLQRTVELTEDGLIAQARQTRELQRDLLRTRMVEFEGISDRLYRVIRLASKESGKQVKLDITGGSIEMDRGVLDRMTPAFEHLLRNCVAHGVETPGARAAAGKDPVGTILIGLHHEGNDVSIEFHDDGAGLNLPRIREKALQQGLISAGQSLTDQEAANLIFMPGFSTASEVTELAGRGIGMDVVRAEVNAVGGRIETRTEAGRGTSFKLVLPLTTAVTQVVMIRSGSLSVGVPANLIEIVRRAPAKEVEQAYNSGQYEFGGEMLPFFWSGALLQASARSIEPQGKTMPVVVFRSAAQRIAVHVDEVLGNQEVVVKNLGPQLARLPGLAGMTVLASGAVVLIYNPVALSTVYGQQARQLSADRAQPDVLGQAAVPAAPKLPAAPQVPLVLVVDDSITVRRVTQRLLQREGYRVSLAADGLQALERLAEEKPAVVLSDIEMPRMDGFDLARNIRGDAKLKQLPIIMITSRIAEKHREHAKELGVDHYLGKPYAEEELLSLVRHYANLAVLA